MNSRGYKIFAWAFLGSAGWALLANVGTPTITGMVTVSAVFMAASDILKAVGK